MQSNFTIRPESPWQSNLRAIRALKTLALANIADQFKLNRRGKLVAENVIQDYRNAVDHLQAEFPGCNSPSQKRYLSDIEIAGDVADLLQRNDSIWKETLHVRVTNGSVDVRGRVNWAFEQGAAISSIFELKGVKNVKLTMFACM